MYVTYISYSCNVGTFKVEVAVVKLLLLTKQDCFPQPNQVILVPKPKQVVLVRNPNYSL